MAIGAAVGGVIGYVTNDIAIRMLFHPYTPKKIAGFTLFPAGVIPRERKNFAANLAQVIGEHFLDKEELSRLVHSQQIRSEISRIIGYKIDNIVAKDLGTLFELMPKKVRRLFLREFEEILFVWIQKEEELFLTSKRFGEFLKEAIRREFDKLMGLTLIDLGVEAPADILADWLLKKREVLDLFLEKNIFGCGKSLQEIFGIEKEQIEKKSKEIAEFIQLEIDRSITGHEEKICFFFADELLELAHRKLGIFAKFSKLVGRDSLASFVRQQLRDFVLGIFYGQEAREAIQKVVENSILSFIHTPISTLTHGIDTHRAARHLGDAIVSEFDVVTQNLIGPFFHIPLEKMLPFEFVCGSSDRFADHILKKLSSPDVMESLSRYAVQTLKSLAKKKRIGKIADFVPPSLIEFSKDYLITKALALLEQNSRRIGENIDIKTLVTEKVKSFSPRKLETIFLVLMKKHLGFINLAGAVLGALIGMMQPVFVALLH